MPRPLPVPVSGPRPEQRPFEHAVHLFLAAVGQGMAFEQALHTFGYLDAGAYSADDRCFYPDAQGLGPISDRVSELQTASRPKSQLIMRTQGAARGQSGA